MMQQCQFQNNTTNQQYRGRLLGIGRGMAQLSSCVSVGLQNIRTWRLFVEFDYSRH